MMKRLILILFILVLSVPCEARMSLMQLCGNTPVAGTCSKTTNQIEAFVADSTANWGSAASLQWIATQITYGGTTGSLCAIDLLVQSASGDSTHITTAKLYTDSGSDTVGTLVSTCSGTYDTEPLTTTAEYVPYTGCSGTVTNGTKYWIVFYADKADSTNRLIYSTDSSCTTEKIRISEDGSTWADAGNIRCIAIKLYILE